MSSSTSVLASFFNVSQAFPQKVAIELDKQAWTYGELLASVERVTRYLGLCVGKGQIVYQFVERSLEMISGLLSIMCAGGVYCPLNAADPPMRIQSLLDQLQGQFVLLHDRTLDRFPSTNNQQMQIIQLNQILSMGNTMHDDEQGKTCLGMESYLYFTE
jgi:non-ribosomal peptide synthetase component F